MARVRWGDCASSLLKLNCPWAWVLVRPASSMPCASLSRMTSSPAAGLLVVEFLTVPVRVWAEERVVRSRSVAAALTDVNSEGGENSRRGRGGVLAGMGSFRWGEIFLREGFTSIRLKT